MSVTIEALAPVTLSSQSRGLQDLAPGETIELPDHVARQVLEKVKGKVRVVKPDWLSAWRDLASLTGYDPPTPEIIDALKNCDRAFEQGNWLEFQGAAEKVKGIAKRMK